MFVFLTDGMTEVVDDHDRDLGLEPLKSLLIIRMEFFILQNVCFELASDQADQARVTYSILHKAEHPWVTQAPK